MKPTKEQKEELNIILSELDKGVLDFLNAAGKPSVFVIFAN